MYAREIDGTLYDFGVSGKLIMNVLVMYDRQTESYWSQLLGEAVEGELQGTRLEFVQSWFTTWAEWRERYPDTVALDKGGRYGDTYSGYYAGDDAGIIDESVEDDRLPVKSFVIGLAGEQGVAVAYPFRMLFNEPLINDFLDNVPTLVIFFSDSQTGLTYERRIGERILTFTQFDATTGQMIDVETGTVWDAWQGVALDGELAGEVLRRLHSTRSFWFGWKDWYPDTQIYGLDAE